MLERIFATRVSGFFRTRSFRVRIGLCASAGESARGTTQTGGSRALETRVRSQIPLMCAKWPWIGSRINCKGDSNPSLYPFQKHPPHSPEYIYISIYIRRKLGLCLGVLQEKRARARRPRVGFWKRAPCWRLVVQAEVDDGDEVVLVLVEQAEHGAQVPQLKDSEDLWLPPVSFSIW